MIDTRDFEQLVRRHQGAVCAVAYSVLRDRGRSEEVAQEAFLIAWQKLPAMSPPPTMPAWICGIAKNLARNAARRKKEVAMDADPTSSETPLHHVLDREADELATRALATLAERDREVVVLYYRGDGSLADVASSLGITELAARQRLHRGRARLRQALATVEATLQATRPGVAFTAACVAALGAGIAPRHADAAPVKAWGGLAAAITVGALALGGGGYAIHRAVTSSPSSAPRAAAPPVAFQRIDHSSRAAILDSINSARTARATTSTHDTSTTTAPALPAEKTKVYDFSGSRLDDPTVIPPPKPGASAKFLIRYAIQQIQPLLLECYTQAAPRLAQKTGTIEVRMRLIGEPEVGTLVDSVTLGGDANLVGDAPLAECMRETLMTVELQPMSAPDTWDVIYPLVIR